MFLESQYPSDFDRKVKKFLYKNKQINKPRINFRILSYLLSYIFQSINKMQK